MTNAILTLIFLLADNSAAMVNSQKPEFHPWVALGLSERCALAHSAVFGCADKSFPWCTSRGRLAGARASFNGKLLVRISVASGRKGEVGDNAAWLFSEGESCDWSDAVLMNEAIRKSADFPDSYLVVFLFAESSQAYRFDQHLLPTGDIPANTAIAVGGQPPTEGRLRRKGDSWRAFPLTKRDVPRWGSRAKSVRPDRR